MEKEASQSGKSALLIDPLAQQREACKTLMKEQIGLGEQLTYYAYELNASPVHGRYELSSQNLYENVSVPMDDETHCEEAEKLHKESFSRPLILRNTTRKPVKGVYFDLKNEIALEGLPEGTREELSDEDFKKLIKQKIIERRSAARHEFQHRKNDKNNTYREGLSPEYIAKLDMLDEISANIAQADEALDYYKETGSLDGFDMLYNCGKENISKMKEWVEAHPDQALSKSPECAKIVAGTIYQGFLEKNNQRGACYAGQAIRNAPVTAMGYEGRSEAEMKADYQQRVKKMFSSIDGLGDVSQYVDLDFELSDGVKTDLQKYQEDLKDYNISKFQKDLKYSDEMTQMIIKGMGGKDSAKQMENVQKAFKNIHEKTSRIADTKRKQNTTNAMLRKYYNEAYYGR